MSARKKWIADTAARLICTPFAVGLENYGNQEAIRAACDLADALEAAHVAPWTLPDPAPSETAAKVGGPWRRIAKLAGDLEKQAHYYGALNIFPVAGELIAIARANGGVS